MLVPSGFPSLIVLTVSDVAWDRWVLVYCFANHEERLTPGMLPKIDTVILPADATLVVKRSRSSHDAANQGEKIGQVERLPEEEGRACTNQPLYVFRRVLEC
jgi:hypothetical protein